MPPKGKDPAFSFSWSYENGGNTAQGASGKGRSVDALGDMALYNTLLPSNPVCKMLRVRLIYMWNLMVLLNVQSLRKDRLGFRMMEWKPPEPIKVQGIPHFARECALVPLSFNISIISLALDQESSFSLRQKPFRKQVVLSKDSYILPRLQ